MARQLLRPLPGIVVARHHTGLECNRLTSVSPSATACSWCGLTTVCGRHGDAAEWRRRKGGRVGVVASGRDRRGWVELEFRLSEVSSFLAGGYGSGLQQC